MNLVDHLDPSMLPHLNVEFPALSESRVENRGSHFKNKVDLQMILNMTSKVKGKIPGICPSQSWASESFFANFDSFRENSLTLRDTWFILMYDKAKLNVVICSSATDCATLTMYPICRIIVFYPTDFYHCSSPWKDFHYCLRVHFPVGVNISHIALQVFVIHHDFCFGFQLSTLFCSFRHFSRIFKSFRFATAWSTKLCLFPLLLLLTSEDLVTTEISLVDLQMEHFVTLLIWKYVVHFIFI